MKKIQLVLILTLLLLLTACQKITTNLSTTKHINKTTTSTLNYASLGTIDYHYSIHSEIDVIIQLPNDLEVIQIFKGNDLSPLLIDVDYVKLLHQVILKHSLFEEYTSIGTIYFTVFTIEGSYELRIQLHEVELPYLMNHPIIDYIPRNYLLLSFDCFGGSIVEINGYNLTHDDYYIDGNTIQIDRFYISSVYLNHYEMNFLEIDYVISFNDVLYNGTFTIDFNRS